MDRREVNIKEKLIITGAAGFIGSNCLSLLNANDYEIHALSSKKIEDTVAVKWHRVDLANNAEIDQVFERVKPTHLLHLAWDVSRKDYNSNHHYDWISISSSIVKAFAQHGGKRIVAAGTCAEYSWSHGVCDEFKTPIHPNNTYAFAKNSFHEILKSYCETNEISYAWGRIFFAYGNGENPNSLISYLIDRLKNNQRVEIKHAYQSRDYINGKDIARGFVGLINSSVVGPVNISTGQSVTLAEIAAIVASSFNNEQLLDLTYSEKDKKDQVIGDNTRLVNEVNAKPLITLKTGIQESIELFI